MKKKRLQASSWTLSPSSMEKKKYLVFGKIDQPDVCNASKFSVKAMLVWTVIHEKY